ncbi:lipid A biosynthesis domain-containing protein [Pseudodesulfovibrio sp. S3]|uniref:lipid A biosynthesis domain-containing protein n=1 Tax=Pseudodesulfovibrio sp. S3 TaxID=2283629 RepID=UPI000FEBD042|nr:lipid A biosynthesis domain-containing protein [Pseudodesulfovibrio sp. S3]MCJ2164232.1 lipid A biosynthesis domain-containing protein [Pseudodesulfovibrio sp. S3-i]RWU05144.1 lipid A biosynthesis domain-containing protein [Pseudodesulfovibrio sp. S3]
MALPAYWWLLAMVLAVQGFFFLRIAILRMRGKGVQPLTRPGLVALCVSGAAGLLYGAVQHDPVFVVGQACLLILYYYMHKERNDQRE